MGSGRGPAARELGDGMPSKKRKASTGWTVARNRVRYSLRPAPRKNVGRMPGGDSAWRKCEQVADRRVTRAKEALMRAGYLGVASP